MTKCLFGIGLSKCKFDPLPGVVHCQKHLTPAEQQALSIAQPAPAPPAAPVISTTAGAALQQAGVAQVNSKQANAAFIQDMQSVAIDLFFGLINVHNDSHHRMWVCTDHLHRWCDANNKLVPTNSKGGKNVMSAVFRQEWWVRRRCDHGADMDRLSDLVTNRNQDNGTYVLHPDRYSGDMKKKYPACYAESVLYLNNSHLTHLRSSDP